MFRLLYSSVATTALNQEELDALLGTSRTNNQRDNLSGQLLHVHDDGGESAFFVQVLEGPEDAVNRTYERIGRDELHTDLQVLARGPLEARRFPGWEMGLEQLSLTRFRALAGDGSGTGDDAGTGAGPDGLAGPASVDELVRDPAAMKALLLRYAPPS